MRLGDCWKKRPFWLMLALNVNLRRSMENGRFWISGMDRGQWLLGNFRVRTCGFVDAASVRVFWAPTTSFRRAGNGVGHI